MRADATWSHGQSRVVTRESRHVASDLNYNLMFRESFVEEEGDEEGREISGRRWAEEEEGTETRDAQQPVMQCEVEKGPRAS